MRYFVKCLACDQTFWLAWPEEPVPDHGRWRRRLEERPASEHGCPGAGQVGYWIGEDEDGLASPC